jgi:hypothetical protein
MQEASWWDRSYLIPTIHTLFSDEKDPRGEGRDVYIRPQNLHPCLSEPGNHIHSRAHNSSSRINFRAEPWMEEEIFLAISILSDQNFMTSN